MSESVAAYLRATNRTGNITAAAEHFKRFVQALGFDVDEEPHLQDTPIRVARMFGYELFSPEPFEFTTFAAESQSMIVVRDIPFSSVCAHHFVPFSGTAHVGYVPNASMVGLSKLARAVDLYARQPQVQERLTEQITDFLDKQLSPLGVGVVLAAEHLCMSVRGVRKPGATTITSALRGVLLSEASARAEFFSLVNQ